MAFPIPTPPLLLLVLVGISAGHVLPRELRPSDHGLEYQDFPSSPTSNPKPPPSMLSFFGTSMSPPSPENPAEGIPNEASASLKETGKHDRVRDVLLVASLACGATGVALLMASGLLFLFKYRNDRIRSGNARTPAVARPMQPLQPPLPPSQK